MDILRPVPGDSDKGGLKGHIWWNYLAPEDVRWTLELK